MIRPITLYQRAANYGDSDAQELLGLIYLKQVEKQNRKFAFMWLQKAAEHPFFPKYKAQYLVGSAYYEGDTLKKSVDKAFPLLRQAAMQRHPKALPKFGKLCFYRGGDKSHYFAREYLMEAEKIGVKEAEVFYILGRIYYHGYYYSKKYSQRCDYTLAWEYFNKARQAGYLAADYYLGHMMWCEEMPSPLSKQEVVRDYFSKIFAKKVDNLHDSDQALLYSLGMIYLHGYGVKRDEQCALDYLLKAAKLGDIDACYQVAKLLYQHQNRKKLMEHYLSQADFAGHLLANFQIACLNYRQETHIGKLSTKDRFERAVYIGIERANYYCGLIYYGKVCSNTQRNDERVVDFFQRASSGKYCDYDAYYYLSCLHYYSDKMGGEKGRLHALALLKSCHQRGYFPATLMLALLYANEQSSYHDDNKALKYLKRAKEMLSAEYSSALHPWQIEWSVKHQRSPYYVYHAFSSRRDEPFKPLRLSELESTYQCINEKLINIDYLVHGLIGRRSPEQVARRADRLPSDILSIVIQFSGVYSFCYLVDRLAHNHDHRDRAQIFATVIEERLSKFPYSRCNMSKLFDEIAEQIELGKTKKEISCRSRFGSWFYSSAIASNNKMMNKLKYPWIKKGDKDDYALSLKACLSSATVQRQVCHIGR